MTHHLTDDQISRWLIGQSSATEQRHVQSCGACTAELGSFLDTLESFKTAVSTRAEKLACQSSPDLALVLSGQTPVAPVEVKEIWSASEFRHARWLSLAVHAVFIAVLLIPPAITTTFPSTQTIVTLYKQSIPLILSSPRLEQDKGGGGGGGRKTLTPPSKGVPPRGADKQIVPPMVEPLNLAPRLVVESTVLAPELQNVRPLDFQIGDPNGVIGPLSAGPGKNGGIGTGDGTGVGPGKGPGVGPGRDGGTGGGIYQVGGGVTAPTVRFMVQPEYSDDARKSRIQGTVDLVIIVQADGTAQVERVLNSVGYGLEQKAIEAVGKWRFTPGMRDGVAVATIVNVSVNFSLR